MTLLVNPRAEAEPTPPPAARTRRAPRRTPVAVGLVLLAQAFVLLDVDVPVLRPVVALAVLLGVPVLVLVRRVTWRVATYTHRVLYASGAVLLGVVLSALAVNTVLPWVGVDRPLARPVLVGVSTVADLALLAWRRPVPLFADPPRVVLRRLAGARVDAAVGLGLLAVATAVLGAVRLNNDAGPQVAVAGMVVVAAGFTVLLARRGGTVGRDALAVYLLSTALLLATSLRGWFVTGHDVQREFYAFSLTHAAEHWQMAAFPDPYNACLSVTLLPQVLAAVTGLSGVAVFKLLPQLLFAAVPVLVLLLGRRLVSRRLAVLGVVFLVAFPSFFSDLPFMTRQEVAFGFLGLALLAATEPRWSVRRRRGAVLLAGLGVVLSHYATTYLLLIGLVLGCLGVYAGWLLTRRARAAGRPRGLVLLSPVVVGVLLATTWVWTGPLTDSGGHVTTTVRTAVSDVVSGRSVPGSSDLSYGLLHGETLSPQQRMDRLTAESLRDGAADRAAGDLVPLTDAQQRAPRVLDQQQLPLTSAGRALESLGVPVASLNGAVRSGAAALLQVFLLVGAAAVWLRSRAAARFDRERRWLVAGGLGAVAVTVLVPGLSVEYGVLRAFMQALLLMAPVVALGAVTLLRPLRRAAVPVACGIGVALLLSLTGVVPRLLGGYPPQLALANSGTYHDLYQVTPQEVSAARWVGDPDRRAEPGSIVEGDQYALARLRTYLGPQTPSQADLFPTELRRGSYVLLGPQTVRDGRATVSYAGDQLTYRYPTALLDDRLDRIYDNGSSEVYR